jgi:hypothetical protein
MPRFWKRKATTSFVQWLKEKHPGLKKINCKWRGAVCFQDGRYEWTQEAKNKRNDWGNKSGWWDLLQKSKCSYCPQWCERLELCQKYI